MRKTNSNFRWYRLIKRVLLLIILLNNNLTAGLDDLPVGARSLAMGGSYVALANTADAVFLNPGGLSQLRGTEISLFYQKPFGMTELNFGTISLSFPFWQRQISFGTLILGNGIYNEQRFVLAYSHKYQNKLYYGISLNYLRLQIENYGTSGVLGVDFGMVVHLISGLKLGFQTKNFNRPRMGLADEKIAQIFKTGISAQPNPKLLLNFELYKDVRFPTEVRFGTEMKALENLALRLGTASNPSRFSAGFGIKLKKFSVDYAFFTHNDLGLTHQMSFSIFLEKNDKKPSSQNKQVIAKSNIPPLNTQSANEINSGKESASPDQKLDINTAARHELLLLPGIGDILAQTILDYRQINGPFGKIEDIMNVPGIGRGIFNKIKDKIIVHQISNK